MAETNKRKERSGGGQDDRDTKRSKGGNGGKWQTPHQKMKVQARANSQIADGDVGIWLTCARNQESRAATELLSMLEECAERFYGVVSVPDNEDDEDEDGSVEDIEKSIQKEVSNQKSAPKVFKPIHVDIPCVVFFKTRPPIDPVDFVHRICEEVVATPDIRRMKYANRLTPITLMGRATEKGLEEVSNAVLREHFQLTERNDDGASAEAGSKETESGASDYPSYAIRPTIRAHSSLKRDVIIKQIASSISSVHKVNLTTPDKVILVEIYRGVCGMSVVGSDWESLKRFNLAELYTTPPKDAAAVEAEASPQSVAKDERAAVTLSGTEDEAPVVG